LRILPVIDLRGGLVVRGVAGKRAEYRPIVSPLVADARPQTVARAFHERFDFQECYVADLNAIAGDRPNIAAWRSIAAAGLQLWLDAGMGTAAQAEAIRTALEQPELQQAEPRLVVGLESLHSLPELRRILEIVGRERLVFSLDLQDGKSLAASDELKRRAPGELAEEVAKLGIKRLIVLDLADVGVGGGTRTLALCREIQARRPEMELVAGGGVRNLQDLQDLAQAGCSVALVASALHDGRLSASDCRAAESWS
jgi:phosphoribosylformimino-5-aminoimidazole carboxamide ribotide isomerase